MKDNDFCEEYKVRLEELGEIENLRENERSFIEMQETFKTLGDATRLKILYLLMHGELCVCEITEFLGANQSAVSHQLRILRNTRLVKYRREGRSVFYSLDDDHIKQLFSQCYEHIEENSKKV